MTIIPTRFRHYVENRAASAVARAQDPQHPLPAIAVTEATAGDWLGFRLDPAATGFYHHQGQPPRQAGAACVEALVEMGAVRFSENGEGR